MNPAASQDGTAVRVTRSTCPYCGVGCGVLIESQGAHIVAVRGDPDHPANHGRLCTKGSTLHLTADPQRQLATRLLQPMLRPHKGAEPIAVDWDTALDTTAQRLADIVQRDGPQAVGFYISGQLLTEDYYVFHKLARGLIGTPHLDSNSRLCMSSAVMGYKLTLGADAPPACYDDVDHADCVLIAGSNTAWAHPVLFRRLAEAKQRRPGMRIIVVDPRKTDTASLADLHLALQPGTDVLLFHGLLHLMIQHGWVDEDYIQRHTVGFAELRALVQQYPLEVVSRVCGLKASDLLTAARWLAGVPDDWPAGVSVAPQHRRRTLSLYCQGLNQSSHGTANNVALIHLHLACGQIGQPGAGPLSLTGQPNAMGGREVGAMATLLSAHRDLGNPEHRAEVARLWGLAPGVELPDRPGWTAVQMFEAAADGALKALWIACTNPAQSMPDQATVRRALQRAELVIVQEAYATAATCAWADVLLPATTWGEKEGTVTNSERRISRVRAAVAPPHVSPQSAPRADWRIVVEIGRRLQARLPARAAQTLFPYASPEAIWNEHRASTQGRDLDISGLSYALLEQSPQQWPYPAGARTGKPRLYEDGQFPTPDGKARFVCMPYEPVAEERCARYAFSLLTGRLRDQWHGMTRTGTVAQLLGHTAEPQIELHPDDLHELGLRAGDLVRVRSRRGEVVLPAHPSSELGRRQCFVPMHWGGEYLTARSRNGPIGPAGINALTLSVGCPRSHQPELKHTAVTLEPVQPEWSVHAMAWLPTAAALRAQSRLRALLARFDYAVCVPFGRVTRSASGQHQHTGVWFKAAHPHAPADLDWLVLLEEALGLQPQHCLTYDDPRRQQHRRLRLASDAAGRQVEAFLLAGSPRSHTWLGALIRQGEPVHLPSVVLLMDGSEPPGLTYEAPSRTVCNCLGITEAAIREGLADTQGNPEERLQRLQHRLRCGTQCGSCLPELKRLVRTLGTAGARVAAAVVEAGP